MAQSALSADPRGLKRICLSCSTRFYDMNKRPIVCPNCTVEFTGEIKIKTRRGRLTANDIIEDAAPEAAVEVKEDEEEEAVEVVSLDDVAREEDADDAEDEAVELDDDEDLDDDLDDDDDLEEDLDVNVDEEK